MKLILITQPTFFVEENQILTSLFEEGLDILHLRKPDAAPMYSERLLSLLPQAYRKKIVTHDHFYLKEEFQLMGIHLNSRNPNIPEGYKGHVSCSCHSLEELREKKKHFNYVFLSPVFDSISKEGYLSHFTPDMLKQAEREGLIDKKVMALGGVDLHNINQLKSYGFGGAVVMGDIWNRFDVTLNKDYLELIKHFALLKRAAD